MSNKNEELWYVIRRRDIFDSISPDSIIHHTVLPPQSTFEELKSMVFSWVNIEEDNNSKIVKLRKYDNTLIPYSSLLQGTTKDKPIIIEVCKVHQNCPVEERTIPPGYMESLQARIKDLEKRITGLESETSKFTASHIQKIEDEANRLVSRLEYVSRRIDQLTPASWPT